MAQNYRNNVLRGQVFAACTAATGVAPGTAIGTTAAFSLYNPTTAPTKKLFVLRVTMGYISGTLGAGTVFYVVNSVLTAAATTGTAITPVCTDIGSTATSVATPFTTATLPATPTVLRPFATMNAMTAATATNPTQIYEECDSEMVVLPGATLSLEAVAAAGTSPLVVFGMVWQEF